MKTQLRRLSLAGLLGAALIQPGITSLRADAESESSSLDALRSKIEELDQQVRILERKQENSEESTGAEFKKIPTIKADDKGLTVESKDKAYQFRLRGLLQTDYRAFINEDSDAQAGAGGTDNDDGFILRRVRPRFQGKLWERLSFEFTPEISWSANSNTVRIIDTYGDFKLYDELNFKFGLFKTPVGLERLQSAANTLFIERGQTTNLVPTRDLGAQVHGKAWNGKFSYAAGIFNGSADSDDQRTNTDTDESVDLQAGVFFEPFKDSSTQLLQGLGFGFAGTFGDHGGTFQNSGRTRYRSSGQNAFFDTNTTNFVYDGEFTRLNPQIYYYNGPWGFLAEYSYNRFNFERNNATAAKGTFESQAWTAQLSYVLTGEDNSYNGIKPLNPVNFKEGGLGAWEIGVRAGGTNIGDGAFDTIGGSRLATSGSASDAFAWGLAVNWYLNSNLRASLNFEQTTYNGAFNNATGEFHGDKPTENLVSARFQVAF